MSTNRHTAKPLPFIEEVRRYRLHSGGVEWAYGIGCAWLGRSGLDAAQVRRDANVLHRAYELGFRYYDTSAAYGDSEIIVGEFIAGQPSQRNTLFVATKSPIPDTLTASEAKAYVAGKIDDSLRRLQTEYIDLLQIHDVYTLEQVTAAGGAIEALREARDAGKIRYIGLGTRPLDLLEQALTTGLVDSVLTYSDYTPIDQSADRLLQVGGALSAGIVNGSPLSAGMLSGADPRTLTVPEWHEESVIRRRLATGVYDLCRSHGVPVLAAALQFPLHRAEIAMNLTGPKDDAELLATLEALRRPIPDSFWQALSEWNDRQR